MSASIASPATAAPAPAPPRPAKPASAEAAAPSAAQSTTASAQQQAALRQLLTKYAYDQTHGSDAATLSALRRQITAAAKTLGQHVILPQAPATAEASGGESAKAGASAAAGKMSLLA